MQRKHLAQLRPGSHWLAVDPVVALEWKGWSGKYWDPVNEDSLNLIAKLPAIAAHIYRSTYWGGKLIEADPKLDWAGNLSHMMGASHHNGTGSHDLGGTASLSPEADHYIVPL